MTSATIDRAPRTENRSPTTENRLVSRLRSGSTFLPHWLADPASDLIVVGSSDGGEPRVLIAHLNQLTGALT